MTTKIYDLVQRKPVARFYYKGSHTHPIRRTVLIIEDTPDKIVGYEFRCGNVIRNRKDALSKIRTYKKEKIAKYGDYGRLTMSSKTFLKDPSETTLERHTLRNLLVEGA